MEEAVSLLRELNDKAPFITTPIAQLPGKKILETMESGKSLEDELLAEVICPNAENITITVSAAAMIITITTMRNMAITTITTMRSTAITTITIMRSTVITTIMITTDAADMIIIMTMQDIIMRMKCHKLGKGDDPHLHRGADFRDIKTA